MFLLPLLESMKNGGDYELDSLVENMIQFVDLSDRPLEIQGLDNDTVSDLTGQAVDHLVRADLIRKSHNGYCVTSFGQTILNKRLNSIDVDFLSQLPGYMDHPK